MKQCTTCSETKSFNDFPKDKRTRDGYRPNCKACAKQYFAKWIEQNRAKKQEADKVYRAANRDKRRKQGVDYYQRNQEREVLRKRIYRAANRELMVKRSTDYYRRNPDAAWKRDRDRRAREINAEGSHTMEDVRRQLANQDGRCYYCNIVLQSYHVDHVIPLSRGGSNNPDNIVCACPPCNMKKHNKTPEEWLNQSS